MKKLFFVAILMLVYSSLAIAQASFSPTIMEIVCPDSLEYSFGEGETLNIPYTVNGLAGAFWFCINTHGKADQVDHVRNGYLGWHFVNNIDTTIYVSGRFAGETGANQFVWDGTSNDSDPAVMMPEDTYSYHIWGYDDRNTPQRASSFVYNNSGWCVQINFPVCYDEEGMVRDKPFFMGTYPWHFWGQGDIASRQDRMDRWTRDYFEVRPWQMYGTAYKWELGQNPDDENGLQYTHMPFYDVLFEELSMFHTGQPVIDFTDNDYYYMVCRNNVAHVCTGQRWLFNPAGDAELDPDFMGFDVVDWDVYATLMSEICTLTTVADGTSPYFYTSCLRWHIPNDQWTPLTCFNIEDGGSLVFDIQLDEYYQPEIDNGKGEFNGTPSAISSRDEHQLLASSWAFCLQEMIDCTGIIDDPYYDDYILWQNQNGDYFMDKKYLPTDEPQWNCNAIDSRPAIQGSHLDAERFGNFWRSNGSADNLVICVATQDGTKLVEAGFFGMDSGMANSMGNWIDVGGPFDGMYTPRTPSTDESPTHKWMTYYVAYDSNGGLIVPEGTGTAVEEEAAEAYALKQNAPNPFNPTTTITYTLANAGDVTIDVFNVAGQKVDTLVNNHVEAGTHSVVWDANGFSAGVYFYSIKSGDFTKTMKMTLLK